VWVNFVKLGDARVPDKTDKMVMGLVPTLHDENSAVIPARRALGHVELVWYRESATKLTWELSGPRIVAVEHAEQSRDQDAPGGAGAPSLPR
jgi:hypothetical protein